MLFFLLLTLPAFLPSVITSVVTQNRGMQFHWAPPLDLPLHTEGCRRNPSHCIFLKPEKPHDDGIQGLNADLTYSVKWILCFKHFKLLF